MIVASNLEIDIHCLPLHHRCSFRKPSVTVSRKRMLQSSSIKAGRDDRSKNKCITILNLPSDLLQEILSRLGLKANIQASAVCKAWCEAAVSVRKLQPRPWLLYPLERFPASYIRGSKNDDTPTQTYILLDPLRGKTYKQEFPELGRHEFLGYKDGWLLVSKQEYPQALFFLDPFTRERVYLPLVGSRCVAFTAAPTSTSCLVISLNYAPVRSYIEIKTWRPGETVWTSHCYENHIDRREWYKCVFADGMFYCLSTCGHLGVFDPPRATWNILPVKPYRAFHEAGLVRIRELMMEHEGDVFVISTRSKNNNKASVFKLNLKRKVWEEKREFGGLTVFASYPASLTRACLSAERNRIYPSHDGHLGLYYSLADDKISRRSPKCNYLSPRLAWVDPPHNQVNLSPYDGFLL